MMKNNFLKFISEKQLISPNDKVLLAVSGGIDSMVMLHLFAQAGISAGIAHCNFQLRGEDSNGDEELVLSVAKKQGLDIHTIRFDTKEYASKNGISIQMAARELRYNWFEQIREEHGYTFIATAHHSDDVVETFLLNLLRKTGISGLHGIRPKSGFLIRPMLFTSKKEIARYAREHAIAYRDDVTNADDHYLRNFIRLHIVPDFQQLNPSFNTTLLNSINIIARQEALYKEYVHNAIQSITKDISGGFSIEILSLKKLSYLDMHLFELLHPLGFSEEQIQNMIASLDSTEEKLFYSPSFKLLKTRSAIEWYPIQQKEDTVLVINNIEELAKANISVVVCEHSTDFVFENDASIAYLDRDKLSFPLEIRHWKPGDYFYPFGGKGKRKLSDFFSDLKFKSIEKQNIKLLCNGNGDIVWVMGLRSDNRYRIGKSTPNMLILRLDF